MPWSQWESIFPRDVVSGPAAASQVPGRLDVVANSVDGLGVWLWWDGSAWQARRYDQSMQASPALVSRGPDSLDAFFQGTFNPMLGGTYLNHTWWTSTYSWMGASFSIGQTVSAPAVASWGLSRLDVFTRTADNQLQHLWNSAAQQHESTWAKEVLAASIQDVPAAVSWGLNRIDVFGRHTDGSLVHMFYNGAWHPWERIEGPRIVSGGPAVASWAPNRLDVFARTPSGVEVPRERLGHWWYEGGWHNESLELPHPGIIGSPAAVSWDSNRIDVFATTGGNELAHMWWG